MMPLIRIVRSNKGQSLIELTLIAPLMVLLAFGAMEVGSVISNYLTLTHTTREGANLASRGDDVDLVLPAIITAAAPTLRTTNRPKWRIIYSRVIRKPGDTATAEPFTYIVDQGPDGRRVQGDFNRPSKLGNQTGNQIPFTALPGIDKIAAGQVFHVFEVYFEYTPVTFVGRGFNREFYDRTVFTNVSG